METLTISCIGNQLVQPTPSPLLLLPVATTGAVGPVPQAATQCTLTLSSTQHQSNPYSFNPHSRCMMSLRAAFDSAALYLHQHPSNPCSFPLPLWRGHVGHASEVTTIVPQSGTPMAPTQPLPLHPVPAGGMWDLCMRTSQRCVPPPVAISLNETLAPYPPSFNPPSLASAGTIWDLFLRAVPHFGMLFISIDPSPVHTPPPYCRCYVGPVSETATVVPRFRKFMA